MKIATVLCVLMLGLSACEWGTPARKEHPDIFTDTVVYTVKTIHERAADCGNKPDSTCTVIKMKYPEFNGQPALNDTVKHKLLTVFMLSEKPDTSLTDLTKHFLTNYEAFKKTDPRTQMFYEWDTYVKPVQQDSALVALEYGGYSFLGGAHGASFTGFINWNPNTKKELTLADILTDGYQAPLSKIAEGIFRKSEKLIDTASLKPNYFFKNDTFALNDNYSITPLGIKFVYNQYEIKPYAAGQTELFIPYAQIRTLIQPKSVVAQYIK